MNISRRQSVAMQGIKRKTVLLVISNTQVITTEDICFESLVAVSPLCFSVEVTLF